MSEKNLVDDNDTFDGKVIDQSHSCCVACALRFLGDLVDFQEVRQDQLQA